MDNTKSYNKFVGERVRTCRRRKGLTMKELGEKIGMSEANVSRYERGEFSLNISQIKEIAKILDVQAKYLCGWGDSPTVKEEMMNKWIEKVGELDFSEKELDELINFAKYIISKRKE